MEWECIRDSYLAQLGSHDPGIVRALCADELTKDVIPLADDVNILRSLQEKLTVVNKLRSAIKTLVNLINCACKYNKIYGLIWHIYNICCHSYHQNRYQVFHYSENPPFLV